MVAYNDIVAALESVFGKVHVGVNLVEGRPVVQCNDDLMSLNPSDVNCRTAYVRELSNDVLYDDLGGCTKTATRVKYRLRFVLYDVTKFNAFDFLRLFEKATQAFDKQVVNFISDTDALYRAETNNRKQIRTKGWGYAAVDFEYAVDISLCGSPDCL